MNTAPMQSSAASCRLATSGAEPRTWCQFTEIAARPGADRPGVVFIVDDDLSIRESLAALMQSVGWRCEAFASAEAFLSREQAPAPSCLILDANLPELSGLDLQRRLVAAGRRDMPVIFISGRSDIPTTVRAMKAGAVEFLTKPFDEGALLAAIELAVARSAAAMQAEADLQGLRRRYASLSPREREVMDLIVSGRLNKQVGGDLGISEITVKAHRGQVMRKMGAEHFADLVRVSLRLQPAPSDAW
jgi:FixJ family two-component response regulator